MRKVVTLYSRKNVSPSFALDFATISDDFTFTRSSFATRVNENGLIETVTDLGSELVSNGDFEELGSELVTNGSFDTDSGWSKVNATISDGKGNLDGDGQVSLLYQNILTDTKTYQVTFTVSNYNGLGLAQIIKNTGASYYLITSNGTFTITFTHSDVSGNFLFRAKDGAIFSIDNVSVKEVDPNSEWGFSNVGGTKGWRIADGRAICDETGVANGRNLDSSLGLTSGITYKLTLDILQSADNMQLYVGGSLLTETLPTGTNLDYSLEFTAPTTGLFTIYAGSSDTQEIDNVSVKEVLENDIPRIDYTNSTFDDVLGSELITNGTFDTDLSSWSIQSGNTNWVWDNGSALMDVIGGGSSLIQDFGGNNTTIYEVTVDVQFTGTKGCRILDANSNNLFLSNGSNTFTTTLFIGRLYFKPSNENGDGEIRIDNVSVKEVTGEIATDKGEFLLEPQSTNLIAYSEDFSSFNWKKTDVVVSSDFGISPSGQLNADKLTFNTTNTSARAQWNLGGLTIGNTYTQSYYIKSLGNDITLRIGTSGSVVGEFTDIVATSDWQRFEFTSIASDTMEYPRVQNITGTSGVEVLVWGAQVEALSYATSYIPTNGSTVTRSAELCVDASVTANNEEGVLYFELSALVNGGTNRYLSLSDGTTTNRLQFIVSSGLNRLTVGGNNNGVSLGSIDAFGYSQTDNHKIAVVYSASGIKLFVDGIEEVSSVVDASFNVGALTTLDFALWNSLTAPFYGRIKDARIYTEALTDSQLEELTTI